MEVPLQEAVERMEARRDGLQEWLRENGGNCFEEQAHTDRGTSEQVYWHYGYLMALRDALTLLSRCERNHQTH